MYIRDAFRQSDTAVLHDLIRHNPFGVLTTVHAGQPHVTHVPFIVAEERTALIGHVARANPHWRHIATGNEYAHTEALVIFQGPHCYISPAWYANPVNVPTWNYTAVHCRGPVAVVEDPGRLRPMLMEMVAFFDSDNADWWRTDEADALITKLLSGIVGIEITLHDIEGHFKLGQNKPVADQRAVISRLSRSDDPMARNVGRLMRANLSDPDTS